MKYIIGIDQSTQGTKALVFDEAGSLLVRADRPHRQIINEQGWVSHDMDEVLANTVGVVKDAVEKAGIDKADIAGIGISNQRETSVLWDRTTGKPLQYAIVWQCARAAEICRRPQIQDNAGLIQDRTGLKLSPYFPAAKIAWLLENTEGAAEKAARHEICHGTVDSFLVFALTKEHTYATDASNASRYQLLDLAKLAWDPEICSFFGIDPENLPTIMGSDACYGTTDLLGYLDTPVPIHGVLGDSHAALFGQGCFAPGMTKATYGTGSSIMMNVGTKPIFSTHGVVSSIAWMMNGSVDYVLEGNINYTGAVISWLKDDVKLISSAGETAELAASANPEDRTYLVPAFTGLGAPYWNDDCRGILCGITRTTGKAEIVKAALEAIAYQITDVIQSMQEDAGTPLAELRVDGGPTKNGLLMQFQADLLDIPVRVAATEELSGMGAAYAAGIGMGFYDREKVFASMGRTDYLPKMDRALADEKYSGWKSAVQMILR